MGDRVLYQVCTRNRKGETVEFGPKIYSHWGGSDALNCIEQFKAWAVGRGGREVGWATAALVKIVAERAPDDLLVENAARLLTENDADGDAGIVRLCLSGNQVAVEFLGGYLKP